MSSAWSQPVVVVQQPLRGPGTQEKAQFVAQSISLTWSWGHSPASAVITYVDQDPTGRLNVLVGASMSITLFGKTFWGICKTAPTLLSSGGNRWTAEFIDRREYLQWDRVFGAFNMPDTRIVNGFRKRRYWHILPQDWAAHKKTFTTTPYSAATILDYIFAFNAENFPGRGTVNQVWQRTYHPDQIAVAAPAIDMLSGKSLAEALLEISERQGTVFTLMGGPNSLVWARKGEGTLPDAPLTSDNQSVGTTLSGHPTRRYIVGDRNLYTVLNIGMVPDWNRAWEAFWGSDLSLFMTEIYNLGARADGVRFNAIPNDEGHQEGRHLAAARALEITVAQYAAMRDDVVFDDRRKFGGRSRMDMPAALYLTQVVFRAFRPPAEVVINGVTRETIAMDITEQLTAKVDYDPKTGEMTAEIDQVVDSNGFVIVQGFNVGNELFRNIRPERFDLEAWVAGQKVWQDRPFTVDDSGENGRFIILDEPVVSTTDWVMIVDKLAVMNARPTIALPRVQAALTFEAEQFVTLYGPLGRDGQENVPGLRVEAVVKNGVTVEVPYADGKTAVTKANEIAAALSNLQYWFAQGGFEIKLNPGDTITDLTGVMNRITIKCSNEGQTAEIEFTSELGENFYQPERILDRRTRENSLLPGQEELRAQANEEKRLAAGLKQNRGLGKTLDAEVNVLLGQGDALTTPVTIDGGVGSLAVGTPIWKAPTTRAAVGDDNQQNASTEAVMPSAVDDSHTVFAGVTVRHNEDAASVLKVQKTGEALVRVKGPVMASDTLVKQNGADYLVSQSLGALNAIVVGVAHMAVEDGAIMLVSAMLGTGGGGGTTTAAVWA